jgi:hypothetical protein
MASMRACTASNTERVRSTALRTGIARSAYDSARRPALDQHLVSNDEHQIHPEHPPAEAPAAPAGQTSGRYRWITFRASTGSLSERRDNLGVIGTGDSDFA